MISSSRARQPATGTAGPPEGSGPNRRCIATGRVLPKERLIRFVVAPDGTVTPDLAGRLPGRGFSVAAERAALERAVAKGLLARAAQRAAGRPVTVPDGLIEQVEALLVARCLELIGLARRAGQAVAGFEKVRGWLAEGRAAVLLEAADGAEGGRARLAAQAGGLPVIAAFDAADLGAALGRDIAVHAALAPGGLATRLVAEAARLEGVHGHGDGGRPGDGGRTDEKKGLRARGAPLDGIDGATDDGAGAPGQRRVNAERDDG